MNKRTSSTHGATCQQEPRRTRHHRDFEKTRKPASRGYGITLEVTGTRQQRAARCTITFAPRARCWRVSVSTDLLGLTGELQTKADMSEQ